MKKEFAPYELAVKLKQLGFDEPCFGRWWFRADMHKLNEAALEIIRSNYFELPEHFILAPTFSQAFRWFREKYNLKSFIQPIPDDVDTYIFAYGTKEIEHDVEDYLKYEEAELACLEKLIEIVEGQKDSK